VIAKLFPITLVAVLSCSPTTYTHGVPNLAQVELGLWRSGQPTAEGWAYLKGLGIRTVVKLNFDSEGSDDGARALGMRVLELGIQPEGDKDVFDNVLNAFVTPNVERIRSAEAVIATGGAVLVHCSHGQDRTGLIIGIHRVAHEHWSKEAAYGEMAAHGFHWELEGLQEFWGNFLGEVP
jgi:tyrosine-protein phosphatase SIW14